MTNNTIAAKMIAESAKSETAKFEFPDKRRDPGQRILDTLMRSTEKELLKDQKLHRARDKAIVANLDNVLGLLNNAVLIDVFVALEGSASASQRKLIETHPMRPEGVTELVEEVDAARALETEKAKAQREAERREKEREQYERLRQKFEADNNETPAPDAGEPKD